MGAIRSDYVEGLKARGYEYYEDASQYSPEPDFVDRICEMRTTDKAWEQATSVIEDSDPTQRGEGVGDFGTVTGVVWQSICFLWAVHGPARAAENVCFAGESPWLRTSWSVQGRPG